MTAYLWEYFPFRDETIYCGQGGLFYVPQLSDKTDAYLKNVRKAGREFAYGRISKDTKEKLGALLLPRDVFGKMADASWDIKSIL